MRRNMAFAWVGNLIIAVHGEHPPSDAEWKHYVASMKSNPNLGMAKSLAITDGGAPTPAQRREVNEIIGNRPGLTAVLSASAAVRGVVTALSWFNPHIKAFSPSDKDGAFRHLQLSANEITEAVRTIELLRLELKGAPRISLK
jgi:hypothetical protein